MLHDRERGRSRTASALIGYLPAAQCDVAAQSVRATEQLTPVQPAEHTQRGGSSPTSTHLPFAEQPSPSEHSAATNRVSTTEARTNHGAWRAQVVPTEQSAPVQPELHRHWGSTTPLTFTATHSPRWLQSGVLGSVCNRVSRLHSNKPKR